MPRVKTSSVIAYGCAAVASLVASVILLELFKADLRVPFDYDGDSNLYAFVVKTTMQNTWLWNNPSVGAPSGFSLYDFPTAAHDTLHLLFFKAASLFTKDWALAWNLYFLAGFPLITMAG